MLPTRDILVLLGVGLALALPALACGTDAVGADSCRQVEDARCRQAPACGIPLGTPVHQGDDVSACIRYYNDACLHGLEAPDPGALQVSQCVALINNPVTNGQKNCDIVVNPQNYGACAWLVPPAAPPAVDASDAPAETGDDGGSDGS
jgi:hypothetical protein